jgi:hypothetical protein
VSCSKLIDWTKTVYHFNATFDFSGAMNFYPMGFSSLWYYNTPQISGTGLVAMVMTLTAGVCILHGFCV